MAAAQAQHAGVHGLDNWLETLQLRIDAEPEPVWYKVLQRAVVRAGVEMDSPKRGEAEVRSHPPRHATHSHHPPAQWMYLIQSLG